MQYLDYIERNIYNGILAQQHPGTGMVAYFLPLRAGGRKLWGSETNDFWCCHGSLVQAQSRHDRYIYYRDGEGIVVAQYIPSEMTSGDVKVSQTFFTEADDHVVHLGEDPADRPNRWVIDMKVTASKPAPFALKLRVPWWVTGKATLTINGKPEAIDARPSSFLTLKRAWNGENLRLTFPQVADRGPDAGQARDGGVHGRSGGAGGADFGRAGAGWGRCQAADDPDAR